MKSNPEERIVAKDFQNFADRREAGNALASSLSSLSGRVDILVLALPRGGVPVAYEVAKELQVPMDLWIVRKLGVPSHEELAMGALAVGSVLVYNEEVIRSFKISNEDIKNVILREKKELERRNDIYRSGHAAPDVSGKTVIIIDDGFATGATMKAAISSLRKSGATWIVAAAPVGSSSTCRELAQEADEVVCPLQPEPFYGVGQWYHDFSQTSDQEVIFLMDEVNRKSSLISRRNSRGQTYENRKQ